MTGPDHIPVIKVSVCLSAYCRRSFTGWVLVGSFLPIFVIHNEIEEWELCPVPGPLWQANEMDANISSFITNPAEAGFVYFSRPSPGFKLLHSSG
jgi:hypothetical protein